MSPRYAVLPDERNMRSRLERWGGGASGHYAQGFFPLVITKLAGETMAGLGIAAALKGVLATYAETQAPSAMFTLQMKLPSLVAALVDDEEVRRVAVANLED